MSNHATVKHRATQPMPITDRAVNAGAHRRRRLSSLPIAGILGIILIIVAAVLATRG
ncbi:hypothetical protein [Nocardioides sp. WS12]|uniref:hypothetical protein n=1 Tax=Nocardioides sp. WS12 TaxID=2486272 RepID=UPI0015F955CE|nr:hypothetical protein [Nocardioides sp. WS12]